MRRIFTIFVSLGLLAANALQTPPALASAYDYDVSMQGGPITFSPRSFYAGDRVRVYGTITNTGNKDISGYVAFYQGSVMIGQPQFFASRGNSEAGDDIWVDWTPTAGTYNVTLRLVKADPIDQNPLNNEMKSDLITVGERPAQQPLPPPVPPPASAPEKPTTPAAPTPAATGDKGTASATVSKSVKKSIAINPAKPAEEPATDSPLDSLQLPSPAPQPVNNGVEVATAATASTDAAPASTDATQTTPATPKSGNLTGVWLFSGGVIAILLLLIGVWLYKKGRELTDESDKW